MIKRSTRLRELFFKEVSAAVRRVKDPGMAGLVTVTDLKLSGDMKTARVFYSVLGTAQDRTRTQRALERAEGHLRHSLYGRLRVRTVPKLSFIFDDTPESAHRVEQIIERIHSEDPGTEPRASAEAEPDPGSAEGPPSKLDSVASRSSRRSKKRRS